MAEALFAFFDKDDIYIIDHDSNDNSIQDYRKYFEFILMSVPYSYYDEEFKIAVCKSKQAELLESYEYVLYADAEEIIIPNFLKYRDLTDYISKNDRDCVLCTSYELIHFRGKIGGAYFG